MPFRCSVAVALTTAVLAATGCGAVTQRYPDDVAAAFARDAMRRLESEHFLIYYADRRHAEVLRFLARAERCASATRAAAKIHDGPYDDKMVIVMPDAPFNNAFVVPELSGYEAAAVIPTYSTLDFTTEFGLVADPGLIACHELTHYTHDEQIAGFWRYTNAIFGEIYDPQIGFDPWMFEGLAVHYEAELNPGIGRPSWPLFTGVFAAGYAGGQHLDGGEMSDQKRLATMGHHYLVGGMFVKFLAQTYGDDALWRTIASQAHAVDGVFSAGSFSDGFHKRLGTLIDEFRAWTARTYPVRKPPATQAHLATVGNDARYTRGRDGTEAWVADDVDLPEKLVVRDAHGVTLASIPMVEIAPPRILVEAVPLLVSGLSITNDGNEVWLTAIDTGTTYEIPRLLRWRRGETALTEVQRGLGPGASIDPSGRIYYYCEVDGDRWSLAAYDVYANTRRVVRDMEPGTYVTGGRMSPDGSRIVADVFDGHRFVEWELDATTGSRLREVHGAGFDPVFDASYTSDGRLMWLGQVAERFQVTVEGQVITDAPYAAYAAREANGTIRFLDREAWEWELAEVALPPPPLAAPPALPLPSPAFLPRSVAEPPPAIVSDAAFSPLDHLFYPQNRSPTAIISSDVTDPRATLGGGDRLGNQRWALTGYVQPFLSNEPTHWGGDAQYLNLMLAPFHIYAEVSAINYIERDTGYPDDHHRTRDALLSISRTFRDSIAVGLTGQYTDDEQREVGYLPLVRHVAGPQLAAVYQGVESTRYTGVRRALEASAAVAYYPQITASRRHHRRWRIDWRHRAAAVPPATAVAQPARPRAGVEPRDRPPAARRRQRAAHAVERRQRELGAAAVRRHADRAELAVRRGAARLRGLRDHDRSRGHRRPHVSLSDHHRSRRRVGAVAAAVVLHPRARRRGLRLRRGRRGARASRRHRRGAHAQHRALAPADVDRLSDRAPRARRRRDRAARRPRIPVTARPSLAFAGNALRTFPRGPVRVPSSSHHLGEVAMTSWKTTTLRLGFAAAIFAIGTAEDCGEGGDVNSYGCPTGDACSSKEPDGLDFQSAGIGEQLLAQDQVAAMAVGGTQTILLLNGSDGSPLEIPATVTMGDDEITIASRHGNVLVLRAGSETDSSELRVIDPATGELFDQISIAEAPIAMASLTKSVNETLADLDDGTPMLLSPGGIGVVGLQAADSTPLIDDSMTITGAGLAHPSWDHFVVGDLAPGSYQLVATTTGHDFTLGFDVAAGADRVALSAPGSVLDGSDAEAGAPNFACFSAFVGARYLHAGWTYAADNATIARSGFEGCVWFTPLVAGPVVVRATAGGLTVDLDTTAAAPTTDHARARDKPVGSRGERAFARAGE